jgi:hypothetical protein
MAPKAAVKAPSNKPRTHLSQARFRRHMDSASNKIFKFRSRELLSQPSVHWAARRTAVLERAPGAIAPREPVDISVVRRVRHDLGMLSTLLSSISIE